MAIRELISNNYVQPSNEIAATDRSRLSQVTNGLQPTTKDSTFLTAVDSSRRVMKNASNSNRDSHLRRSHLGGAKSALPGSPVRSNNPVLIPIVT